MCNACHINSYSPPANVPADKAVGVHGRDDEVDGLVGFSLCVGDGGAGGSDAEDATSRGDDPSAVVQVGAGVEDLGKVGGDGVEDVDDGSLCVGAGVAVCSHNDGEAGTRVPLEWAGGLATEGALEGLQEVRLQSNHDALALWVSEAYVVF